MSGKSLLFGHINSKVSILHSVDGFDLGSEFLSYYRDTKIRLERKRNTSAWSGAVVTTGCVEGEVQKANCTLTVYLECTHEIDRIKELLNLTPVLLDRYKTILGPDDL